MRCSNHEVIIIRLSPLTYLTTTGKKKDTTKHRSGEYRHNGRKSVIIELKGDSKDFNGGQIKAPRNNDGLLEGKH